MSNTGIHPFTANQSIYQLSDKDHSVPDVIDCEIVFGLVYSPEFSAIHRDDINFHYIFAGQVEANTLTQTRESTASCGFFVRWPICLSIFVDGQFKTMLLCAPILRKLEVKQQSKS